VLRLTSGVFCPRLRSAFGEGSLLRHAVLHLKKAGFLPPLYRVRRQSAAATALSLLSSVPPRKTATTGDVARLSNFGFVSNFEFRVSDLAFWQLRAIAPSG